MRNEEGSSIVSFLDEFLNRSVLALNLKSNHHMLSVFYSIHHRGIGAGGIVAGFSVQTIVALMSTAANPRPHLHNLLEP
jgi:hypothetical protein